MLVGPKYKICKRLGSSVFEKCQTQKFALAEARRGADKTKRKPRALSDFGKQHLEKQRIRFTYGITEGQLSRYVAEAVAHKGTNSAQDLVSSLERRLDNVVYRSGLAVTRRLARQMVSHGHITVNGKRVNVPSYRVGEGDTFAVRDGSKARTLFMSLAERLKDHAAPSWIAFDAEKLSGRIVGMPASEVRDLPFNIGLVLEFYSR